MAIRCPEAVKMGSDYISGWKLVFRTVADIIPTKNINSRLPVGIWKITDKCEIALDRYEGYPNLYGKSDINGMMTYKMNSNSYSLPSESYFNTILEGYKDFNLDTSYLLDTLYAQRENIYE